MREFIHPNQHHYHPQTAAIRCGHRRGAQREHNEPILTRSSGPER